MDSKGMLAVVVKMPEMIKEAAKIVEQMSLPEVKGIRNIVITGMGGSAISGDIIADLLRDKLKIPIYVNRGYKLPAFVDKNSLVFAISYSGNTEETISAVNGALQSEGKIICVTSGGKLREIAEKEDLPLYLVPSGYQPRAAMPFLLIPILDALNKLGLPSVSKADIDEGITLLEQRKKETNSEVEQFALAVKDKLPIIYAVFGSTASAGLRLKTQFNENSKVTALYNLFPELNHNEIVSLSFQERGKHNYCIIFLRDQNDNERVVKRMEITKSLLGSQFGGIHEIWTHGKSKFAKLISLIYYGDLLSVHLANLQGIDPTPVDIITKLKKELLR
jgi:glucose/mannose-6-phosphate isomerase